MPGYDVTAAARFSEQGKALDTARCGGLSPDVRAIIENNNVK